MTTSEGRPTIERAVVWRSERLGTLELCRLKRVSGPDVTGWEVAGFGVARVDGELAEFNYHVHCDEGWRALAATIHLGGPRWKFVLLRHTSDNWEGTERRDPDRQARPLVLEGLAGCVDVDLGITPSTNTLPIRRLNLQAGESADVTAAWVRFPELTVEPLAQRYTRLDERRYRYESASGFVAELEVDELGLVVRYGDIWERVGE